MASLDQVLKDINDSLNVTLESCQKLQEKTESPELPPLVEDLLLKTSQELPEGVSLLDLKNNSMLSYLNNILLVVLSRIELLKTNSTSKINDTKIESVKRSIVQRVVMERGIKNLEKKLQYQLEKMIRNYSKMETESSEQSITKKIDEEEAAEKEDSEEEEDSEDELNYRPDTSALMKSIKPTKGQKSSGDSNEKYKPPKISAALPPQQFNKDVSTKPRRDIRKLQAMEEYLAETGDAPMTEQSIGSNILNNGRGGIETAQERRKQQEITNYEESNFTRLSTTMSKKDKAQKRRQQQDTFFGEDWGIFNKKNDNMNTKRAKPQSTWERAKRRRT